jgi:CMP/dCMP kinase
VLEKHNLSANGSRLAGAKPGSKDVLSIAIDGPVGAGKSTVACRVAAVLKFLYLDTGAMYRAATWVCLQRQINLEDEESVVEAVKQAAIEVTPPAATDSRAGVVVDGVDVTTTIRSPEVTGAVSRVSAIAGVRDILVERQRQLAQENSVVMDGRDIGTVVLPRATLKIYLTASPLVRAQRRHRELAQLGQNIDLLELQSQIEARDHYDSTRAVAPLRPAADAIPIDTNGLTIDQVVERILALVSNKVHQESS